MRRRHPYPKRVSTPRFYKAAVLFLLMAAMAVYGYYRFDRHMLPLAMAMHEQILKTAINDAIHTELQTIITSRDITAADFYTSSTDPNGNGVLLSVNTVLVNDLCNAAALAISQRLSGMEPQPVSIPMGMAFGLDTLANRGPKFTFTLSSTGNALVNYESRFESVGINQVHFEVWLTVVSHIRVINPVQAGEVTVTREVSLVDTVITGMVPDTYLNVDGLLQGEK